MRIFMFVIALLITTYSANAQRLPDTSIDRMYIGLAKDQGPPVGQISPWDSTALDAFLDDLRAEIDAKVTDPDIRAMAEDLTLRQMSEGQTHYYQSTYVAFEIFDQGTQQDQDNALFIFLANANRGDPFAFEGIELYFENNRSALPPEIGIHQLTRKAADLDLLPAMERLTFYWLYDNIPETPDTIETYLRYALDIAGQDGFPPIAQNVLDFYVHAYNTRPADGYAARALDQLGQFESAYLVEDYRSFMHRYGVDLEQNQKLELDAAIRSVALGSPRMRRSVGYMYLNARGTAPDYDLARDINYDCYITNEDTACLTNLGSLYTREENPHEDFPLALALYRYAVELDPSLGLEYNSYIQDVTDYLYAHERRVSDTYLSQIRQGDFSDLPHLGDVRPVDYDALLTERTSQ